MANGGDSFVPGDGAGHPEGGQGEVVVESEFASNVENIVGPILRERGFVLDGIDDNPDSGGRQRHIVYYRSADCKLQVYQSSREGEVNCMIAPVDVPNEFGLNAAKWLHITGFTMRPDLPFEELLRAARNEYESYSNPIYWVRDRIEQNFDAARAEMLSLG